MPDEISEETSERVSRLIGEYARLCGRTNTEVAHALLCSKTLRRLGYRHAQMGRLTEAQGWVATKVLAFWIRSKHEQHQQGRAIRQPDS